FQVILNMECGAGKHWTEEEVKALLTVWSERNIQRYLHGATRNKAMFIYISSRLQDFGVFRDWKQCRAKYKNLNFNAEIDRTQLLKHIKRTRRKSQTPVQERRQGAQSSRPPRGVAFIPPVATEGGKHWTDDEVRALLYVWSDRRVQAQLEGAARNRSIFQEIARRLQRFGIERDWKQCRTKYKNLKYEYKTARSSQGSGRAWKNMKFFKEVESILENRPLEQLGQTQDRGMDFRPHNPEHMEEANERCSNTTLTHTISKFIEENDLGLKKNSSQHSWLTFRDSTLLLPINDRPPPDRALNQFRVITVNDSGIGRNWSDDEVRALILVWSDEGIRQQLEGATRNKDIFLQISRRLLRAGVDRDWKQCRTKYKNLKYVYRALQRGRGPRGDPRRVMRFYDEVDAILRRAGGPGAAGREEVAGAPSRPGSGADNSPGGYRLLAGHSPPHSRPAQSRKVPEHTPGPRTGPLHSPPRQSPPARCSRHPDVPKCSTSKGRRLCVYEEEPGAQAESLPTKGIKRKAKEELPLSPRKCPSRRDTAPPDPRPRCKEERAETGTPTIQIGSVCSIAPSPRSAPAKGNEAAIISGLRMRFSPLLLGQKLSEGKTKQIYELPDLPGHVLVQSKDQITAGNAARKDQLQGKAALANGTTCCVFRLLQEAGVRTAFVRQHSDTAFVAARCEMVPIEWVCRRVATGSFLKRNPGVSEGYRFAPPKLELFFKDDANNDPQWSEEQLQEARFCFAGLGVGRCEIDIMSRTTVAIFEILERAWDTQGCTLVDMKVEFGVNVTTKEIVLADVIDNDSWRLWPSGDRSQQKDKQVYRDLKEVTPEAMQMVKRNFEWVSERVKLLPESRAGGRVVVLMGSTSDMAHCTKIRKACEGYGVPCLLRVTSAHKGPDETLRIKAEYEGDGVPTVFVAVAGRSNGLGPVMSGNTAYPVINCPPVSPDWGAQDIWSSLRMPSGLGCSTVLSPDGAAQFAAQIFGLTDHLVWAKLRASMLNTWVSLKLADKKLQECSL
uniref:PurE domain-containing protein n=1 Tax=Lepisosteus oculatus TaxID=7918 RepID=W5N9E8_LEPOC